VRQAAVRQLKACSERYSAHVSGSYRQYLEQMAQPGFWGDHVSLQVGCLRLRLPPLTRPRSPSTLHHDAPNSMCHASCTMQPSCIVHHAS
jgi:hypothetical protein